MTQYYSRTDIPYAGDSNFTIPFSYIDKDDISVYVNDELITTWTWLNDSQINISSTLTTGDVITIKRNTPIDEKIVTYQNMSMVLSDDNLNLSQDQVLNAVQEIWDNNLDTTVISREALTKANTAVSTANSANSKADNAVSTANTASSNASTALSNSQTAINTANSASNTATSASETATAASNKVDEFGETIQIVIDAAETIETFEEAIQTAVDAASTASDKADIATNKATEATNAAARAEAVIPSQTGQNGKFLKTNGTSTSWEEVDLSSKQDTLISGTNIKTINNNSILGLGNLNIDALPSQTGNANKFLKTDGTDASWADVPSRNIGEIVASTLPLTDAGLHLLDGALIDGNGIYSDFVDYIAGLYDNSSWISWTQPVATSNETPITGGKMICSASSQYDNSFAPWKSMDNVGGTTYWASPANTTTGWWQVKFPYPIKITGLTFYSANNTRYCSKDCRFYTSSDMTTPIGDAFVGSASANTSTVITGISADGIITDTIYLNVTSSHDYGVGLGKLEITATKNNADYFTTEANWQTAVTTYGVCGKFVYDSSNNTVRLPKITGIIEGTTDVTALGDLVEAGLPNITGTMTASGWKLGRPALTGAFYREDTGGDRPSYGSSGGSDWYFDASRSNPIYGNSTTVQPQTIKAFYYIVIATTTKTAIQVDIDEIATDLNGKADVDLTNTIPTSNFATTLNTAGIRTVVETYLNGKSWYRVYSDGWIEQGGYSTTWNSKTSFIKNFSDTNYTILLIPYGTHNCYENACISSVSVDGFTGYEKVDRASGFYWVACGY